MEKVQILCIGRDPVVLQKLSRFILENPKWESTATVDDITATAIFDQRKFDIVLLLDDIEEASEKSFHSLFELNNPDVVFLKHKGSSTGLLAAEINEALEKKRGE